jgi:hypothetical protein
MLKIQDHQQSDLDGDLFVALYNCLSSLLDDQVEILRHSLYQPKDLDAISGSLRLGFLVALKRQGRLNELRQKLQTYYPTTLARFVSIEPDTFQVENLFENRTIELDKIFWPPLRSLSHCWLVVGPSGYGKTEFLREVASRFLKSRWFVIFLTMTDKTNLKIIMEEIAEVFELDTPEVVTELGDPSFDPGWALASTLSKKRMGKEDHGLVLILDDLHLLTEPAIKDLVGFVDHLFSGWTELGIGKTRALKVISSSRNQEGIDDLGNLGQDPIRLSPFDFKVVRQSVQNFSSRPSIKFDLESSRIDAVGAYLCHVSGGHPGCLVSLLNRYYKSNLFKGPWPTSEDPSHVNEVRDIVSRIEKSLAPLQTNDLINILDHLCVLRKFNDGILSELVDKGWFAIEDPDKLWNLLAQTRLVEKRGGFLADGITRRLFFCRLRNGEENKRQILTRMCLFAIDAYCRRLTNPEIHRGRHIYAIELLYHRLQQQYYVQGTKGDPLKKTFLGEILPSVLNDLLSIESLKEHKRGVLDDMIGQLGDMDEQSDWEFAFDLNYFTSEHGYAQSTFQTMMQEIKSFRAKL